MGVEITDEMVVAYFDVSGSAAWEREIEALSGWPRTEYMVRAGLAAVAPLIAAKVRADAVRDEGDFEASIRADERRKVAEEWEAAIETSRRALLDQEARRTALAEREAEEPDEPGLVGPWQPVDTEGDPQ